MIGIASAQMSRLAGRRELTLPVVAAATTVALVAFTTTVTTVAASASTFSAGVGWQTWILSGMSLGLAGALLTIGAVADIFGHRRVFVWASVGLGLFSGLGALAPSVLVLVVARVLQGAAAAGLLAAGLGLLGDAVPDGRERTRATGMWGAALAAGIAIGPVMAGALTSAAGWRSSYWLAVVAAAGVALAAGVLPEPRERRRSARLDPPGALTMVVAMASLTAGITEGRSSWTSPVTLVLLGTGVAALALFAMVERRRAAPMLDLGLLRRPAFLASVSGAAVTGLATIALMTSVPTLLERGVGITPLAAGAVLAIWSLVSMAVATQVGRLPERLGSQARLAAGLVASAVGTGALGFLGDGSSWWALAPGLAIAGIGSGVVNAALARLAVESVPPGAAGVGSGANNTARYLGSAVGIALVVAIIASGGTGPSGLFDGWNHAAWFAAAVNLAGAGLAALARKR